MIFVLIVNIMISVDFTANDRAANANDGEHESDELRDFELAIGEVALTDIFKGLFGTMLV